MDEPEEVTTKKKNRKNSELENPVIYIGPSIPQKITSGRILKKIPKEVEGLIAELPVMQELFITATELCAARKELINKRGLRYSCYCEVERYLKKGE